uniref:SPRY domain-containing protein n=1 Tax=Meloidogyne hapla TaxID=6305 RepID=A0A1I8C1K9_MELHA
MHLNIYLNLNILGIDKRALVYSENRYKRPEYSINYSLFYFEIKCKIEKENFNEQILNVGFRSSSNLIKLDIINGAFVSYKEILLKECKITSFTWNNNDIFGCGLVYPPTNKTNKFPYVFFTQNGAQIGKSVLLKDLYCDYYEPYIILKCFSVETNFGNDLNLNPFIYDIKKHFLPKEFYVDTDEEDSDFGRCNVETNFGNDLKEKLFVYDITKHLVVKEFLSFSFHLYMFK